MSEKYQSSAAAAWPAFLYEDALFLGIPQQ